MSLENGHDTRLKENHSIHAESLTIAFKLCWAWATVPVLELMPTGCCQHAGRYSFPKYQTTKFMHEKILISYLVLVKEYKACCPGLWGRSGVFFLIPGTIGFCQCCWRRPSASFDVNSTAAIYNSNWVGHVGRGRNIHPARLYRSASEWLESQP